MTINLYFQLIVIREAIKCKFQLRIMPWAQQITQIYRFLTQSMIFLPMINKYAQSLR